MALLDVCGLSGCGDWDSPLAGGVAAAGPREGLSHYAFGVREPQMAVLPGMQVGPREGPGLGGRADRGRDRRTEGGRSQRVDGETWSKVHLSICRGLPLHRLAGLFGAVSRMGRQSSRGSSFLRREIFPKTLNDGAKWGDGDRTGLGTDPEPRGGFCWAASRPFPMESKERVDLGSGLGQDCGSVWLCGRVEEGERERGRTQRMAVGTWGKVHLSICRVLPSSFSPCPHCLT